MPPMSSASPHTFTPLAMPNPSVGTPPVTQVEHEGIVVIVGANGSGKSRLGAWLEIQDRRGGGDPPSAHRISAQRALEMPDQARRHPFEVARVTFNRGGANPAVGTRSRVVGDPVIGHMADFQQLVDHLFAEQGDIAAKYMARGSETKGAPGVPPETMLQKVQAVWGSIFTEREIIFGDHQIMVRMKEGEDTYSASQMSDGERVGFYLVGEVLLANSDLIVVDEPELHVHESIQSALWDTLEAARPNCTFVYITHDLTFAASRARAPKVVLYDYDPTRAEGRWTWDLVPAGTGLPEDVVLRIAGSRRPTIFTEGVRGGLDEEIFAAIYPHCHIVPSESVEAVIHSVGTFKAHAGLHRYEVSGLIDRDDRNDDEVEWLAGKGVHALPVAGPENLLLLPEALSTMADHLMLPEDERNIRLEEAKKAAISLLKGWRDKTIAQRAQHAIERQLSKIPWAGTGKQDLIKAVQKAQEGADPEARFEEAVKAVDGAINAATIDEAYERTLVVFREKGLITVVAREFGIKGDLYRRILLGLLRDAEHPFSVALRTRLPTTHKVMGDNER
jgi:ABC-type lipoprotein export system ATPase subunit